MPRSRSLLSTVALVALTHWLTACAELPHPFHSLGFSRSAPHVTPAPAAPAGRVKGAVNVLTRGDEAQNSAPSPAPSKDAAKTPKGSASKGAKAPVSHPVSKASEAVKPPQESALAGIAQAPASRKHKGGKHEHEDPLPPKHPAIISKDISPPSVLPAARSAHPEDATESDILSLSDAETPFKRVAPEKETGLRLEDVTASAERHYPDILRAQASSAASEGKVQEKQGAFDWEWKQKYSSRIYGEKYDGSYMEHRVGRRVPGSAASIYGGYSVSAGSFPVYEQEFKAEDAGELNVGAMISLWRDRIIDSERASIKDAELELAQKRASQLLARLTARYEATIRYVDWLTAGFSLKALEEQLALAEHRQSAFKKRVHYGDLARIFLTENLQNLVKRKAYITETRRKFQDSAIKLSLYYRDAKGNPIVPKESDLPADFPYQHHAGGKDDYAEEIELARSIRPEKIVLSLEEQRAQTQLALSRNQLLPKVDLTAEAAQSLNAFAPKSGEAKVGLSVVIPLQLNKAKGAIRRTEAEVEQIRQRRRLLDDQIAAEIQYIANRMHAAEQTIALARQETEASEAMRRAEETRFEEGETDFFVLNMREEKVAQAKISLIEGQAERLRAIAGYDLATLRLRPPAP